MAETIISTKVRNSVTQQVIITPLEQKNSVEARPRDELRSIPGLDFAKIPNPSLQNFVNKKYRVLSIRNVRTFNLVNYTITDTIPNLEGYSSTSVTYSSNEIESISDDTQLLMVTDKGDTVWRSSTLFRIVLEPEADQSQVDEAETEVSNFSSESFGSTTMKKL